MFPVVWALPRWGRKVNRWLLIVVYLFVFCLVAGCLIVAAAQWGRKVNRWILIVVDGFRIQSDAIRCKN